MNPKELDKKLQKEAGQLIAQGLLEEPWYTLDPDDVEAVILYSDNPPSIIEMSIYNQFLKRMVDAAVELVKQERRRLKWLEKENEGLKKKVRGLEDSIYKYGLGNQPHIPTPR